MSTPFARQTVIVFVMMILLAAPAINLAESMYSGNAPDGRTGAPGEGLCTDCHASFAVNSGDGAFTITGLPTYYIPGQTYTVEVTIQDAGQQRWGFELTAKDPLDNGAGSFTITDAANTQKSGTDPEYVKHTSTGTYAGTPDGPATWSFDWTAPASLVGEITFYAAGNAANNNGSTSGDYIYTTSHAMAEAPTPPIPAMTSLGMIVLIGMLLITGLYIYRRMRISTD